MLLQIFCLLFKNSVGVSLNVTGNPTEGFVFFASTCVLVLDQFEVVGVEPEDVVVGAFVLVVGTVCTVEGDIKVSKEEVKGFNGCKRSVKLACLVAPEDRLLGLDFYHLYFSNVWLFEVGSGLIPSAID